MINWFLFFAAPGVTQGTLVKVTSLQDHWILNGPFDRGTDWDLF